VTQLHHDSFSLYTHMSKRCHIYVSHATHMVCSVSVYLYTCIYLTRMVLVFLDATHMPAMSHTWFLACLYICKYVYMYICNTYGSGIFRCHTHVSHVTHVVSSVSVCIYIYMYIHIYVYTYIHIYMYVCNTHGF